MTRRYRKARALLPTMRAALLSVGVDPEAPIDRAAELVRQAEALAKKASRMLDDIPPGQPIVSIRDRNRRERAAHTMRKAADLFTKATNIARIEQ